MKEKLLQSSQLRDWLQTAANWLHTNCSFQATFSNSSRSCFRACCFESLEDFGPGSFVILPCDCFDLDLVPILALSRGSAARNLVAYWRLQPGPSLLSMSGSLTASLVLHCFCLLWDNGIASVIDLSIWFIIDFEVLPNFCGKCKIAEENIWWWMEGKT